MEIQLLEFTCYNSSKQCSTVFEPVVDFVGDGFDEFDVGLGVIFLVSEQLIRHLLQHGFDGLVTEPARNARRSTQCRNFHHATMGGSNGGGRGRASRKPQISFFYKQNTTSSCTILQVYGSVVFNILALLGLYYFANYATTNVIWCPNDDERGSAGGVCILLQVHRDNIPEPTASVDHFAGSRARRLRFVF